jgi:hypothetical protein
MERKTKKSPSGKNDVDEAMSRNLDTLSEFDEFNVEIAPALRGAIKAGKSPEEIYNLVLAHASARMVSIALTEKSPAIAMAALKDILDRTKGKATENKAIKLDLANTSDEALDAKLKQLMSSDESETVDDDSTETLQ